MLASLWNTSRTKRRRTALIPKKEFHLRLTQNISWTIAQTSARSALLFPSKKLAKIRKNQMRRIWILAQERTLTRTEIPSVSHMPSLEPTEAGNQFKNWLKKKTFYSRKLQQLQESLRIIALFGLRAISLQTNSIYFQIAPQLLNRKRMTRYFLFIYCINSL